MAVTCCRIPCN